MTPTGFKLPILLAAAFMISGCGAGVARGPEPGSGMMIDDNAENSPYYNYTRAELHKEKGEMDLSLTYLKKALELDPESVFLQKEMIGAYLLRKDEKSALAAATALVDQNPDDVDGLMIMAKLKQVLNLDEEAREIYQKILNLKPDNQNIYLILGRMYMDSGNTDEALRLYTTMSEYFPEAYAAHFFLGKIHAEKQNVDYAEKEFLKTIELDPSLVEPRFELIKLYQDQEQTMTRPDPKIIRLYDEIQNIEPHNFTLSIELPLYYYHHGRIKKAEELMAASGKKIADTPRLIMLAAKELFGEERFNDAAILFTGMLKGAPDSSAMNYLAAIAFDSLKEGDKAIEHFEKVMPDSENYKKSIIHLAFLYSEHQDKAKAIAFLKAKQRELPEDVDLIMYLASFYEDEQRYADAMQILARGIELAPDNASLYFRMGIIQDKAGYKDDCIASMKKVIAMEPDNASALNYLGYTYADLGKHLDEAEILIKKALEIRPDDGFITDSLGWVYYQQGDYKKAVELLEKAAGLSGEDPVIVEHLGDAYVKVDLLQKALDTYIKAQSKTQKTNPALEQKITDLKARIHAK